MLTGVERVDNRKRFIRRVRVPTILQMEATECGAASLAMVLAHYGLYIPLEQLRVDCGVSRDGSNALHVLKAARRYGCQAQGLRLSLEKLDTVSMPLILFWEFNHFVVLEGRKGDVFHLNDPGRGPVRLSFSQMSDAYTGVALQVRPGPLFKPGGRAPSLWAGMYRLTASMKSAIAFIVVTSVMLAIPGMVIPSLSRIFVDDVLGPNANWLGLLLMALGGTTLVSLFLTWLQRLAFRSLAVGFITLNTTRMFFRLLRLPMLFHMQRSPGEIQFRLGLNNQLADMVGGQVGSAVAGLFMLVCYGALLLTYDVPLALTGMAIAGINLIVLTTVARFRKVLNQSLIQEKGKLMAVAMSGIQLIDTIKASAGEFDFFQRWAGQQAHYVNSEQRMSVSTIYVSTLPVLLSALNNAVILLYGAWRVIHGHMTAGMLVAFQFLMVAFLLPVTRITELGSQVQAAKGALDKLDDVDNYELDPLFDREFDEVEAASAFDIRGELELRGVTFGYSPVAPPVVTDFSLRLRPGSHVAVVGRSGSGKSTVAKLAAGLYRPWSGDVLYDGLPIADWPRRKLERFVAIVDQQIVLFRDSLQNNLSMWNPMMDEENLIRACRDAQIHEDIVERAGGYAADMDEGGGNFSGGQRQRIEIARALTNDPAVLILDEATSALDPETERRMVHHLRQRGCSCLIVAHRLSTIRDCDEIIVLDDGRVVQRGRHEALIQDETGVYARMIRAEN